MMRLPSMLSAPPRHAANACSSVKAPLYSARPQTAERTPRSRSAVRCSSVADAARGDDGGAHARAAAPPWLSTAGPSRVPSRSMSVNRMAAAPQASTSRATSSTRLVRWSRASPRRRPCRPWRRARPRRRPDARAQAPAPSSGFLMAAVPSTTRVAPALKPVLGRLARADAAAHLHLQARSRARGCARSRRELPGLPSRAPSRSTTCRRLAPALEEAPGLAGGIVGVDRDLGVVALVQAHDLAVEQVDGGNQLHHSTSDEARASEQRAWPLVLALLGVELAGEHVVARDRRAEARRRSRRVPTVSAGRRGTQ